MENVNENKSVNGLVGMTDQENVPKFEGVYILRPLRRSLNSYPQAVQEKIQKLRDRKALLRKMQGHCSRCGKPHAGKFRRCDKCRAWQKRYKQRIALNKKAKLFIENGNKLVPLERRIASLEIAVARLQLDAQTAYKRGYRKGLKTGQGKIETNRRVLRYEVGNEFMKMCKTSHEELRTLCHAY
jgi:hypothetical protein